MVVVVPDAAVRQGPHSRSVFRILKQLIIDLARAKQSKKPAGIFCRIWSIKKLEWPPPDVKFKWEAIHILQ